MDNFLVKFNNDFQKKTNQNCPTANLDLGASQLSSYFSRIHVDSLKDIRPRYAYLSDWNLFSNQKGNLLKRQRISLIGKGTQKGIEIK